MELNNNREMSGDKMSVANSIKAWALLNIEDIFRFMITATDDEIEERYITEKNAVDIAEKYLNVAQQAHYLQLDISGWSFKYSQPTIDGSRIDKEAFFSDRHEQGETV